MSDERGAGARKCLVWDLDLTVWDGILAEGDDVKLRPGVLEVVRTLDERGIVQSIASKNGRAPTPPDVPRGRRARRRGARFDGPKEEFLSQLDLRFTVGRARASDLQRVEELTLRTNQLNATGYTYSYEELDRLRVSDDHLLLVAGLDDRYGSYGKIGVALVERGAAAWTLKLLLMSCRVMSRGVGSVMLAYVMEKAQRAGVPLLAEFVPTERNRQLYVMYRFAGFEERETRGKLTLLEHPLAEPVRYPSYVTVVADDADDAEVMSHARAAGGS